MASVAEHPQPVFDELAPPLSRGQAIVEADRCLECGGPYADAPCVTACPTGVDVPGFIAAIARDEPEAAAATIFTENLLGGTCARVCPVETLCEAACVLVHEGRRPIEIGRLQRCATDVGLDAGVPLRRTRPRNWYPVAPASPAPANWPRAAST
jgi:dihydropyrimidine dehydrogenase (NAD+) subunit PreT